MVFIVDPQYQLPPGTPTSGVDCLAYSGAMAYRYAKRHNSGPSGRTIRLLSDEPRPDAGSPGLNLHQVADVLAEHFGMFLEVYVGDRALTWNEYEAKRTAGRGGVIQVGYGPISDTKFDASGNHGKFGHGMFEDNNATDDPLADGRRAEIYDRDKRGPIVYPREMMKRAAGLLVIGQGVHLGYGHVWCGFTRDVIPKYRVRIRPFEGRDKRTYRIFTIRDGVIVSSRLEQTKGFESACTIPRAFRWPSKDHLLHNLVKVTPDPRPDANHHVGEWVALHHAHEV